MGRTNNARAREMRILQPPEKSLHFFCCISVVNPGMGNHEIIMTIINKSDNTHI